jgi:hypothetical protein
VGGVWIYRLTANGRYTMGSRKSPKGAQNATLGRTVIRRTLLVVET